MSYPAKAERNIEIVKKRQSGWPWMKIARHYGLNSHGTVWKIYQREVVHKSAKKELASPQA